jgi:MHS family proline/betaine transporter-like MFS transporter
MTSTPAPSVGQLGTHTSPGITRGAVLTLSTGTIVEWFDFALYGFSSTALAAAFFPHGNSSSALLATLAIYGVSFLARPVGGIVFGRIGDEYGRRTALLASILIMGFATAAVGLIPTYATIGIFAPALLVLSRLVQGFAASTELTGAQAYVAEAAPAARRGSWISAIGSLGSVGTGAATLLVLIFHLLPGDYAATGWRWPFVVGGAIAIVGMLLRMRLTETEVFLEARETREQPYSLGRVVREHWKAMLAVLAYYAVAGIAFQTLVGFMPTYMTTVANLSATTALLISLGTFTLVAVLTWVSGVVSDHIGRKPVLIGGSLGIIVLTVPAYLLIGTGALWWMCVAQALLAVPLGAVQAGGQAATVEMFPARVRYSCAALSYTFSYAVFAGTAPLLDDVLFRSFGHAGPAYYAVLIGLVALPLLLLGYPETRGFSIRDGRPAPSATPRKDTV